MFDQLRRKLNKRLFTWRGRDILKTPSLRQYRTGIRVVSLVRGDDVGMYLVAIKSFARHLPGCEITVIDDGTLNAEQKRLLDLQLGGPEIVDIASIDTGRCPRGGCWERLMHILDLSRDTYVVQLDADMLTRAPVPEVLAAIEENRAFTLNSGPDQPIISLEASAEIATRLSTSLQTSAELALPRLPPALGRRYVRGSAGFAGFARGGPGRDAAEAFSVAMQAMLGEAWSGWGSEQVASNYIVSNSSGGVVLPWPKYCLHYPGIAWEDAAMLHFIGSWRFEGGVYMRASQEVIAALRRETHQPLLPGQTVATRTP
jgi:hypothetical protein